MHLYVGKITFTSLDTILFTLIIISIQCSNSQDYTINKCFATNLSDSELVIPDYLSSTSTLLSFKLLQKQERLACQDAFDFKMLLKSENSTSSLPYREDSITSDGLLQVFNGEFYAYYNPEEYCIQRINELEVDFRVCNATCSENKPCIPKCCPPNKIVHYSANLLTCVQSSNDTHWTPNIYQDKIHRVNVPYNYTLALYKTQCQYPTPWSLKKWKHFPDVLPTPFRFLRDGNLTYHHWFEWGILPLGSYCIDNVVGVETEDVGWASYFPAEESDQLLLVCGSEVHAEYPGIVSVVYILVMLTSSVFLLITILMYIVLWDKQNIHGYTVFFYIFSLFFWYIFLSSTYILRHQALSNPSGATCTLLGVFTHFFFISTFCWLTIINFDLWWTFRYITPNCSKGKCSRIRLMMYFCFGWGIPIIIVATGIIMDIIQRNDIYNEIPTPKYGQRFCNVIKEARGWYIYFPVGCLLSINAIFYTLTVCSIYRYKQSTKDVLKGRSTKKEKSLILFTKLFLVMGISWGFEVFSWWIVESKSDSKNTRPVLLIIFDCLNILQSLSVFVIFVCKRKVYKQMMEKYSSFESSIKKLQSNEKKPTAVGSRRNRDQGQPFNENFIQATIPNVREDDVNRSSVPTTPTSATTTDGFESI